MSILETVHRFHEQYKNEDGYAKHAGASNTGPNGMIHTYVYRDSPFEKKVEEWMKTGYRFEEVPVCIEVRARRITDPEEIKKIREWERQRAADFPKRLEAMKKKKEKQIREREENKRKYPNLTKEQASNYINDIWALRNKYNVPPMDPPGTKIYNFAQFLEKQLKGEKLDIFQREVQDLLDKYGLPSFETPVFILGDNEQ